MIVDWSKCFQLIADFLFLGSSSPEFGESFEARSDASSFSSRYGKSRFSSSDTSCFDARDTSRLSFRDTSCLDSREISRLSSRSTSPNSSDSVTHATTEMKPTLKSLKKTKLNRPSIHKADEGDFYIYIKIFLNQLGLDLHVLCLIGILITVFLVFLLSMTLPVNTRQKNNLNSSPEERLRREQMVDRFVDKLQPIVNDFSHQPKRLWQSVKATTKAVLREASPQQPAVLLLAAQRQHSRTAECLARSIASSFTAAYDTAAAVHVLKSDDYNEHPEQLKKHLEMQLSTAFQKGSRAIIINEVDAMSGKAAMIFHAYCDNENAPHRDVALVFTLFMDDSKSLHSSAQVEAYLYGMWQKQLDVDVLSSLLSRIANNVVIVQGEEDEVLQQHCV